MKEFTFAALLWSECGCGSRWVTVAPRGRRRTRCTRTWIIRSRLLIGLLAGGVSCAAVQGGLLAGLITRQHRNAAPTETGNTAVRTKTTQSPLNRLADDFAPVGGFLIGKLVSHSVLGALLGALGTVVQMSVGTRTALQLIAGVVICVLGPSQLGVPGFRNIVIEVGNAPVSHRRKSHAGPRTDQEFGATSSRPGSEVATSRASRFRRSWFVEAEIRCAKTCALAARTARTRWGRLPATDISETLLVLFRIEFSRCIASPELGLRRVFALPCQLALAYQ
ncbi:urease accessory protein UreH domain-containing protein [Saccharopolyspora tripterygii]